MAEACQVHVVECDGCMNDIVIRVAVEIGDKIECGTCGTIQKIKRITAPHRDDRKPKKIKSTESVM